MKKYDTKQHTKHCQMKKDYCADYGVSVGGWFYAGWISYNAQSPFELLVSNSLISDHGEKRIVVKREDGIGVNCFWKES